MSAEALIVDIDAFFAETKDIRDYYTENIRSVYGPYISDIDLSKYDGTVKEIVTQIFKDHEIHEDVDAKIETFSDELPYAYYNVAGHDNIIVRPGVKDLISKSEKGGFIVGVGTNCLSEIAKIKFDRAGIASDAFKFYEYGSASRRSSDVINAALADVDAQGIERSYAVLASASQSMINAAASLGVRTIGIGNKSLSGTTAAIPDFRNIIGITLKM
jgi:hypothetical protein